MGKNKKILFKIIKLVKQINFVSSIYELISFLFLQINSFSANEKKLLLSFFTKNKDKFSRENFKIYNNIISKLVTDKIFFFEYLLPNNKKYMNLTSLQQEHTKKYLNSVFNDIEEKYNSKNRNFNYKTLKNCFSDFDIIIKYKDFVLSSKYREISLSEEVENLIDDIIPIIKINLTKESLCQNIDKIIKFKNSSITSTKSLMISNILNIKGYSIEPDFKLTNKKYQKGELVCIYKDNNSLKNFVLSDNYNIASLILELGCKIAIDCNRHLLINFIKKFVKLNSQEILRLEQKQKLLLKTNNISQNKILNKIHINILNNNIKLEHIINFIISVTIKKNTIADKEIEVLKNIFTQLGFNKKEIYDLLKKKNIIYKQKEKKTKIINKNLNVNKTKLMTSKLQDKNLKISIENINKEGFKKFYPYEKIGNLLHKNIHITDEDCQKYLKRRTINILLNNCEVPHFIVDYSISELEHLDGLEKKDIDDILSFIFNIRNRKIILKSEIKKLIQQGKEQRYLTFKQIDKFLSKKNLNNKNIINNIFIMLAESGIEIIEKKPIENINKEDFKKFYPYEKIGTLLPKEIVIIGISNKDFQKNLNQKIINILLKNFKFFDEILDCSFSKLRNIDELTDKDIDDILSFIFDIRAKSKKIKELIEKLIKQGKRQGYLVYNEINKIFIEENLEYSFTYSKFFINFFKKLAEFEIKIVDENKKELLEDLMLIGKKQGYVIIDDAKK